MSETTTLILKSLEARRTLAFTIAGVLMAANLAILLFNFSAGTEDQFLDLGQALIGGSWAVGFLGLLGFYPSLSERSRWLTRIGGIASVIGFVAMVVMTIISFSTFVDLLSGSYGDYVPLFLPGIFIGIVFGFGSFGIATLRFGTYTTTVGALFLLLVCTFLFNVGTGIAGVLPHLGKVIGIVTVLTVTNLALGHLLRTGRAESSATDASMPDSAA
jgi:hypothetical protein